MHGLGTLLLWYTLSGRSQYPIFNECDAGADSVDLSLREHFSPIEWGNVVMISGIRTLQPVRSRQEADSLAPDKEATELLGSGP